MKLGFLLLLAALGAPTAGAIAQPLPPLTSADVVAHLQNADARLYFPEQAQRDRVSGSASAICTINAAGALVGCVVQSEEPGGYGFGEALVRTASLITIEARARNGSPTAGRRFYVKMNFRLPGS